MLKRAIFVLALLCFAGMASGATVALSDSVLQGFVDFGWNSNTLNSATDITGDPGTAYNVTLTGGGWTDVFFGAYNSAGLNPGDQWELTVHNPDAYQTFIQLFLQVDGWAYTTDADSGEGWVDAGATKAFVFDLDPGILEIYAVGIKVGTDAWTGRDSSSGSTFEVHITPEPASLLLLGLGGLALRRRRR